MKKNSYILILIALVCAVVGLLVYSFLQRRAMTEMVEQMEFEKSELEDEYEDLALQFDGYQQLDIRNDSLQDLLSQEQQRVQDLLEELRITKVTNARRIAELKKELATVRAVMKDYVRQIDSLNATNHRLTVENLQYREENQQVRQQNNALTEANSALSETVSRAAMLEITSCTVTTLNKRDRKTRFVNQITKFQFDFTIGKNITCQPGNKQLFVRIITPGGNLLGEEANQVFDFENEQIPYTLTHPFEYGGEAYSGTIYWPIEEGTAEEGYYNADFFVEGNLVGSYPFQIKK